MMQWLKAYMQMPKRRKMRCFSFCHSLIHAPKCDELHSVVVARFSLLFIVFPFLLFSLTVALLGLELIFPELVDGVGVNIREDDLEHIGVPGDGLAFDAFFDVLAVVSICASQ